MIPLSEPERWREILLFAQQLSEHSPWIKQATTIGADIFLVVYPIFLVAYYLSGVYRKDAQAKIGALAVFLSCVFSVLGNIGIQMFFVKARPLVELQALEVPETLLHQFLPQSSFPSDHAVVGMSLAVATLLWSLKTQEKKLKSFSIFLFICAVLMGISRVFTIVHWPSDILWGFLVGSLFPLLLLSRPIFPLLERLLIQPLIRFQEWLFRVFSLGSHSQCKEHP